MSDLAYNYMTPKEYRRSQLMGISKTSIFALSSYMPNKPTKPFEPNGDITKVRWKIMA